MPGIALTRNVRSAKTSSSKGWDHGRFLWPVAVAYKDGCLTITFKNDDVVAVKPEQLTPERADWSRVAVGDGYYIEAPGETAMVEIPTTSIREITNPAYGRFSERSWRYTNRSIGAHLRRLRKRQGLTQQELARRIGARQPNIARLEKGEREPGIGTVASILAALDLDWADMTIDDTEYAAFLEQVEEIYRRRTQDHPSS